MQQPENIPNNISPFSRLGGYYFTFTATTTRSPLSRNLSLRIIGTKPCFPRLYYHCTYASWLGSGSWSWPCCKKLVIWLMKSTPLNFWRPWLLSKDSDKYNFLFHVGFLRTHVIFLKRIKIERRQKSNRTFLGFGHSGFGCEFLRCWGHRKYLIWISC